MQKAGAWIVKAALYIGLIWVAMLIVESQRWINEVLPLVLIFLVYARFEIEVEELSAEIEGLRYRLNDSEYPSH